MSKTTAMNILRTAFMGVVLMKPATVVVLRPKARPSLVDLVKAQPLKSGRCVLVGWASTAVRGLSGSGSTLSPDRAALLRAPPPHNVHTNRKPIQCHEHRAPLGSREPTWVWCS